MITIYLLLNDFVKKPFEITQTGDEPKTFSVSENDLVEVAHTLTTVSFSLNKSLLFSIGFKDSVRFKPGIYVITSGNCETILKRI